MFRAECSLTQAQYRDFMHYHVLGRRGDLIRHAVLCLLFALFGGINFLTDSPMLGWIFVTLALYLFASRYIRFYASVNRIVSQYGLTDEPKFFYAIAFGDADLQVRNSTETAVYPYDRLHLAVIRPLQGMIYLYVTAANAFLIPASGLEGADLEQAAAFLEQKMTDRKVLRL